MPKSLWRITTSPPPAFNFAVLPDVKGEEAYWGIKAKARENRALSDRPDYEPIEMPRNSPTGIVAAFFATAMGFALIWHIWWLAIVGLVGIIGAMLAYLWYNSPPAEIYMGDAGSIGLGGAIGIMFVLLRIELFLPIVGAVLVAEALSVLLQITGFKFTRRFSSDGQGRRLFLRAPLHHHYQMKWKGNFDSPQALNSKILWRFHLVSILALILGSLIFFKVR